MYGIGQTKKESCGGNETKDTGGPAFPEGGNNVNTQEWEVYGGMTLRDYFAAKALPAILERLLVIRDNSIEDAIRISARDAYRVSDAMIAERNEEEDDE